MKYSHYFLILFIPSILLSCSTSKRAFKQGEKQFKKGNYELAISKYQAVVDKNYKYGEVLFKIAESYRLSNRNYLATPFYRNALTSGYVNDSVQFYLGVSLKDNGLYDSAKTYFINYSSQRVSVELEDRINHELDKLDAINSILRKKNYFTVKNLKEINTPFAEYSPVYQSGILYFTSSRSNDKIYQATGTPFTDIHRVESKGANIDPSSFDRLLEPINTVKAHEACPSFARNGNILIFARSNTGKNKGRNDVDIFITRYKKGGWTNPNLMALNDGKEWDSTPTFSTTGKSIVFASSRSGGYGGTDLYVATLNTRGQFAYVYNLGPEINTQGNEMFPHLTQDGKLYFASSGHPGLGGLDIFMAHKKNGKYIIENLGSPINSYADDFGYFAYTPVKGFFCSNRKGGIGDDDIYTFKNNDPNLRVVNYLLIGKTLKKDPNTELKLVLRNTLVKLFDSDSNVVAEEISKRDGSFSFRLYEGEKYDLVAQKRGYFTTRIHYDMTQHQLPKEKLTRLITNHQMDTTIVLEKLVVNRSIILKDIYYDFDKANIRLDAQPELNFLADILKDNPDIKIELSSHTDNRGEHNYNMELSQKRAESAVNYIIKKGIVENRLIARGYGETKPIIANAQTEEDHQTNRRTEFKVIEFTDEDFFGNEDSQENRSFFDE